VDQATCPHCGTELPPVSDAFCPECRGELEKSVSAPRNLLDGLLSASFFRSLSLVTGQVVSVLGCVAALVYLVVGPVWLAAGPLRMGSLLVLWHCIGALVAFFYSAGMYFVFAAVSHWYATGDRDRPAREK
jgi:hypothetical protein